MTEEARKLIVIECNKIENTPGRCVTEEEVSLIVRRVTGLSIDQLNPEEIEELAESIW